MRWTALTCLWGLALLVAVGCAPDRIAAQLPVAVPELLSVAAPDGSTCSTDPNTPVVTGCVVQLNGDKSRAGSGQRTLSYRWSFTALPAGSRVTLSDSSSPRPTFKPDVGGTTASTTANYLVQLVVNDGVADSSPATAAVRASDGRPGVFIQILSPQSVGCSDPISARTFKTGTPIQLQGSSNNSIVADKDGHPINYTWRLKSKPPGSQAAFTDAKGAFTAFTPDVVTTALASSYIVELVIDDGPFGNASNPDVIFRPGDTHRCTFAATSGKPTAKTGIPATSLFSIDAGGDVVVLDGGASFYPDAHAHGAPGCLASIELCDGSAVPRHVLNFAWTLTAVPSGSSAVLTNATIRTPSFTADAGGDYTVQLKVNDGSFGNTSDPASATVRCCDSGGWIRLGLVLPRSGPLTSAFDALSVEAPSIIADGGTFRMYYAGLNSFESVWSIGLASTSTDLVSGWTKVAAAGTPTIANSLLPSATVPLVTAGDGTTIATGVPVGFAHPMVIKEPGVAAGNNYKMWASVRTTFDCRTNDTSFAPHSYWEIHYFESPDGLAWSKPATVTNPVLARSALASDNDGGAWDAGDVLAPTVTKKDGLYYMWYAGDRGIGVACGAIAITARERGTGQYQVGLATSSDGIAWTKFAGNPVLASFNNGSLGSVLGGPTVALQGAKAKMWFPGVANPSFITTAGALVSGNATIQYSSSTNLTSWTTGPWPVALSPSATGLDSFYVGNPSVLISVVTMTPFSTISVPVPLMWYAGSASPLRSFSQNSLLLESADIYLATKIAP